MQEHLSLGTRGSDGNGNWDGVRTWSGTFLAFHPLLEVMQRCPYITQPREDESGADGARATMQYLVFRGQSNEDVKWITHMDL